MHHVQPLTWRQTPENIPSHPYSDDHLWLLLAIPAYLKETADFAFLDTVVPFADAGNASVYDHMKLSMEFSQSQRGPHGLLLGLAADWNDCINLRGKGESMFSTFLYYKALEELIILATRLGKAADAAHFTEYRDELKRNIDAHAWDGEWFLRGYLDSGRKLGGHESEQSRIFLNSQTWAVVSGAADPAKATSAMDSLHKYLATEHGCVKNYPAFRDHDAEIGAVTSFPPGLKENAGIFCHANTWAVIAECLLGRGSEAYKLYKAYLPAAKNDTADTYTMEPYVYSQFITGKEHHKFGRARNSWLTGTASWSFVAISQHILGLRATYDGLEIDPCIPPDWDGFTATRTYRGATYKITIKNPNHVSKGVKELKVNGKTIEGNQAPIAEPGQTVKVEATLG
jgi:N,N'-diacetylchitobiose phosphorylase